MGDDSSRSISIEEDSDSLIKSIKKEWSLFWESISGEESEAKDLRPHPLKSFSQEDVQRIIKTLSQDRRKINRKIESLNQEIESYSQKIQSMRESGKQVQREMLQLQELNEQGQKLSQELTKLDQTLKFARGTMPVME